MLQSKETHPRNKQGKRISNYEFIKPLGQGNFGTVTPLSNQVYLAKNLNNNENVAIKCILLSRFTDHRGLVGDLVKNEKNALMRIDHTNVVKIYEYIESLNQAYLVIEYCNGGDLQTHWENNERYFQEDQALDYFKQIVQGMKALHEKLIIHRDLKLANILVHREEGTIKEHLKIADLGFCHILSNDESTVDLNLGSLGTKAPEIVQQQKYGFQADMFSMGAIFYQLLMGKIPFGNFSEAQFLREAQFNNPPKMDKLKPEIQELLINMLQFDVSKRLKWSKLFSHPLINQEQIIYSQIEQQPPLLQLWDSSYEFYYDKDLLKNKSINQEIFTKKWVVQFFRQTYFFIHRVYHINKKLAIFPGFMMSKLIFKENQLLIEQVKQLNSDNLGIRQLLSEIQEDQTSIQYSFEYEKQAADKNWEKFVKFVDLSWKDEIKQDNSEKFHSNLMQCLDKYIQQLQNELDQDKNKQQEYMEGLQTEKNKFQSLSDKKTSSEAQQQIQPQNNEIELVNKSIIEYKQKLQEFKLKNLLIIFIQKEVEILSGRKVTYNYMDNIDSLQQKYRRDINKIL